MCLLFKIIMQFTGSRTNSFINWCSFELWACTFCYIRVWVNGRRAFNEWLSCEGKWEALFCLFASFLILILDSRFSFKWYYAPFYLIFSLKKVLFYNNYFHTLPVVVYFICLLNDITFLRCIYVYLIFITLPLLP